ncbi:glutaredoxin [Paenibacillus spongiae]|uniref:Glutaredoxin n=1 Tax=Paenibacillus spongiae TaxID=2909671 RepID=A0ABY5S1L6_9BACL|nr:glutaredoxin [Paenibacillus spongiae]UVI27756.1 glutaredoxin [Paenibacillus spongiae]
MGATIEIFADGSPSSSRIIDEVKALACSKCEIIVYHLHEQSGAAEGKEKAKAYGILAAPAVTLNGRIVDVDKWNKEKTDNHIESESV